MLKTQMASELSSVEHAVSSSASRPQDMSALSHSDGAGAAVRLSVQYSCSVRQKGNLSKENIRRSDLDWTSHLDDFFQAQDRPSKRDGSLPSPSPLSRCALSPSCCRALSFC